MKKRFITDFEIDIAQINEDLKELKVSRLVRGKVLKVFYNYTNLIQDSILFIFLLDFVDLVKHLNKLIKEKKKMYDSFFSLDSKATESIMTSYSVNDFEEALTEIVEIFQKGYQLRLLNSSQFEEITDFDLDFNSSPQQLLSSYNSMAKGIHEVFFESPCLVGPYVS